MAGSGIAQHSIVNSKSRTQEQHTFENQCLNAKLLTYAFADYIMLSFSS